MSAVLGVVLMVFLRGGLVFWGCFVCSVGSRRFFLLGILFWRFVFVFSFVDEVCVYSRF